MVRSFIAVDINNSNVIQKIENIMKTLSNFDVKMKMVEIENLHITLRFLGEIEESDVAIIKENVIDKINCNSFDVNLKGLGSFPSIQNPRVIWIGIAEGFDILKKIKKDIDNLLIRNGFKIENEDFVAHLTIARIKYGKSRSLEKFIEENKDIEIGSIKVNSIKLKKSTLMRNGPIYEDLAEANCK